MPRCLQPRVRWRALSAVPPKAMCEPSLVETAPPFFVEPCPSAWRRRGCAHRGVVRVTRRPCEQPARASGPVALGRQPSHPRGRLRAGGIQSHPHRPLPRRLREVAACDCAHLPAVGCLLGQPPVHLANAAVSACAALSSTYPPRSIAYVHATPSSTRANTTASTAPSRATTTRTYRTPSSCQAQSHCAPPPPRAPHPSFARSSSSRSYTMISGSAPSTPALSSGRQIGCRRR